MTGPLWHHIGIYAFRGARRWRGSWRCRPSPLELREKLEQLRALEAGMACRRVARVDHAPFGVDTPEDLERASVHQFEELAMTLPVAFQGWPGAYSDMACRAAFSRPRRRLPCENFEADHRSCDERAG